MKKTTIAILMLATMSACTQPDKAKTTLENAGYTDVEITGYRPFMKSEDDTFSTGFRATSPAGKVVTGAVTGGWLKGNTIRTD